MVGSCINFGAIAGREDDHLFQLAGDIGVSATHAGKSGTNLLFTKSKAFAQFNGGCSVVESYRKNVHWAKYSGALRKLREKFVKDFLSELLENPFVTEISDKRQ